MEKDTILSASARRDEIAIKKEELAFLRKQLKWNTVKSVVIALATTTAVGIVATVVSWHIQQQEIKIKELEQQQSYISQFSEFALNEEIQTRIDFAFYVSQVATTPNMRDLWARYHTLLEERASETRDDLRKARDTLRSLLRESREAGYRKDDEIEAQKEIIARLETQLDPRFSELPAPPPLVTEIRIGEWQAKFTSTVTRTGFGTWEYSYLFENMSEADLYDLRIGELQIFRRVVPAGESMYSAVQASGSPTVMNAAIGLGRSEVFQAAAYAPAGGPSWSTPEGLNAPPAK